MSHVPCVCLSVYFLLLVVAQWGERFIIFYTPSRDEGWIFTSCLTGNNLWRAIYLDKPTNDFSQQDISAE